MVDCLSNLDKCNAECCRVFTVTASAVKVGKKYHVVKARYDADKARYYRLRGAQLIRGQLRIPVSKFRIEFDGKYYHYYNDCEALEGNLCGIHEFKPLVCRGLDWSTAKNPKYYITPNCIFRSK